MIIQFYERRAQFHIIRGKRKKNVSSEISCSMHDMHRIGLKFLICNRKVWSDNKVAEISIDKSTTNKGHIDSCISLTIMHCISVLFRNSFFDALFICCTVKMTRYLEFHVDASFGRKIYVRGNYNFQRHFLANEIFCISSKIEMDEN